MRKRAFGPSLELLDLRLSLSNFGGGFAQGFTLPDGPPGPSNVYVPVDCPTPVDPNMYGDPTPPSPIIFCPPTGTDPNMYGDPTPPSPIIFCPPTGS